MPRATQLQRAEPSIESGIYEGIQLYFLQETNGEPEESNKQHQNTKFSKYQLEYLYVLLIVKGDRRGWSVAPVPRAFPGISGEKAAFS